MKVTCEMKVNEELLLPDSILHKTSYQKGKKKSAPLRYLEVNISGKNICVCARGKYQQRRRVLTFFEGHKRGKTTRNFEHYPFTQDKVQNRPPYIQTEVFIATLLVFSVLTQYFHINDDLTELPYQAHYKSHSE